MTYSFICPECKHQFITRDRRQKYCSRICASQKRKFPKHGKHLLTSDNPCSFHWRILWKKFKDLWRKNRLRKNALKYRRDRRKRFREYFMEVPIGILDSKELAGKAKIPWRTALAYLRELHREGLVHYKSTYHCMYGCHFDVVVWSRIK